MSVAYLAMDGNKFRQKVFWTVKNRDHVIANPDRTAANQAAALQSRFVAAQSRFEALGKNIYKLVNIYVYIYALLILHYLFQWCCKLIQG